MWYPQLGQYDLELAQELQEGWEELELVWPGAQEPKVGWQTQIGWDELELVCPELALGPGQDILTMTMTMVLTRSLIRSLMAVFCTLSSLTSPRCPATMSCAWWRVMVSTLSLTLASRYRRIHQNEDLTTFHFLFIVTIGNSNQPLQQSFLLLLLSITTLSKNTIATH